MCCLVHCNLHNYRLPIISTPFQFPRCFPTKCMEVYAAGSGGLLVIGLVQFRCLLVLVAVSLKSWEIKNQREFVFNHFL